MPLLRHAAPIVALVLLVAACQTAPGATPGGASPATSDPASPAATSADPTAAGPTTTTLSPEDFGGTWTFVAGNPRVLSATGSHEGGSIVVTGDRYRFVAGEYSSEGPIEFSGTKEVDCTTTSCRFEGVPVHQLFLVEDHLAILNAGMLTPIGSFGDSCAWVDVPDGGIVTVVSTGTVAGQEVPTVVRFADGTASGVGEDCADGSHSVAWDVTATREP
jgi:hypothetical protein